jgi:hypothetical protein
MQSRAHVRWLGVGLLLTLGCLQPWLSRSLAQAVGPAEVGTVVNGFQDDFNGTTLASGWIRAGSADDVFSVGSGSLHVATANGDPNHLVYSGATYDPQVQEVLARMRVLQFGTGDAARGGVVVGVDPAAGVGINFHFRDGAMEGQTGRHLSFLDDFRAWGPGYGFSWQLNTWYWVRLRQDPGATIGGATADMFAKIWPADGVTAEPTAWQTWNYSGRSVLTSLAGIAAGSSAGTAVFDVDYVLIKAAGLPPITVAPAAVPIFRAGPVIITNQPADLAVTACTPATFKVGYDGTPPHQFQWFRGTNAIPGATNPAVTIAAAALADDGATFRVRLRNVVGGVTNEITSRAATLHVAVDPVPPALSVVESAGGLSAVHLVFTKPVSAVSAAKPGNYQILKGTQPLAVQSAQVSPDGLQALLLTEPQTEGATYSLRISNLFDACTGTVPVESGTAVEFQASIYASADVGSPTLDGSITPVPGGYDLQGSGTGVLGTADQLQFSYQPKAGNFDVQVRVAQLVGTDAWTEAGLMARDSLNPNSKLAFVLATPSISGALFKSRATDGAGITQSGSYPVNYPDTWLRLQRVGNSFTGYASRDGRTWTALGQAVIAMSAQVSLGMAVASHSPAQPAFASFRNWSDVSQPALEAGAPTLEPMGQSSRKTGVVISEIMYHPGSHPGFPGADGKSHLEFVELFNTQGIPEDLGGYRIDGDIHYTFPPGTFLAPGASLVVARTPADLTRIQGATNVFGPYTGNLSNSSGKLQLRNPVGAVFLEVVYGSQPPWPVAADGGGHSLVLVRPSLGEKDPRAWALSDLVGGSPGRLDGVGAEALRGLVINEFVAHSESGPADFIELYNATTAALDASGCVLSDRAETDRYILPAGTTIPAGGHLVLDQARLGFALGATGGTIYLRNPAQTRVLDAIRYEAQADQAAFGRCPDGSALWRNLATPTPGSANAPRRLGDVVINEILADPISGNDDDQFVELYNRTGAAVDLGGWQFTAGIQFTFPSPTVLPAHGYLAVSRDAARLLANRPDLGATAVLGDFSGTLSHNGERLALARPEQFTHPAAAGEPATTNQLPVVVSEATYATGGRWGKWTAGGGSSLELVHPDADPEFASSWADSDETAKAAWTEITATGTIDNGSTTGDSLQILLQDVGEALIDNIEVRDDRGANLIANGTFETGLAGWTAEGTMASTSLETTGGFQSSQSLHLRAVDRGDNQVNRVRSSLVSAVRAGTVVTIKAKARWLKGSPTLLLRIRGNWMEAPGVLNLPVSAGSPGSPNSRFQAVAPPGIREVTHAPILPADSQPVRVTARISSPAASPLVRVNYRLDPATTIRSVTMTDDGTGGDAVAGDGIYTGTLPGQPAGTLLAYTVTAQDTAAATGSAVTRYPSADSTGEALIRFGEQQPAGNVPLYRFWVTQANFNAWNSRSKLNNTPLDCTFVLGNQRVIHNTKILYAGSPYIAPGYCGPNCGRCGYSVTFPDDDLFLGSADMVLDWPGGHGNETTALQEQMAYWMAGKMALPTCYRYPIRLHLNGVTDDQRGTIFEAVNQPASEFLKAWMPADPNGDFFKVDRAFDFNDGGSLVADPEPTLQVFTTTGGVKKAARYRWNWNKRAGSDPNNYQNIFDLVDAVNAAGPEPYTQKTEALVDVEEWMGIFATEHIINNFDSWGHVIGKNMYAYKPKQGKWQIYMFDLDWLMLAAPAFNSTYTAKTGPLFVASDPTLTRMYNHPPFRRAYFRAIQRAVAGPLRADQYEPQLAARYASYVANGIRYCDGSTLTAPDAVKTWFNDRRIALQAQLDQLAVPFAIAPALPATTTTSPLTVKGSAPIGVKSIQVNGVEVPVTWTSVTNWSASIPLLQATNALTFTALDPQGTVVPGIPLVFINEWMADNATFVADHAGGGNRFSDWFELYNAGPTRADLSGYFLTDNLSLRDQFKIPAGYTIAPDGRLLVWADNLPTLNAPDVPDLHVNFQLSAKGEAIGLFAPDGTPVDTVTFGPQTPDVSEGRSPDGGPTLLFQTQPTPGTANVASLRLDGSVAVPGTLHLEWSSVIGTRYAVESAVTLDSGTWTPVVPPVAGDGTRLSLDVPMATAGNQFIRLRAVP